MAFFETLDWENWIAGLFAGAIGGGATAVYGAFAVTMVDPEKLAFGSAASFKVMGLLFAMSFVKDAALFLKQHPIPNIKTVTTVETVEKQQHPPAIVTTTVQETKIAKVDPAAEATVKD